jgi:formate dehydrogenase subunit gamma
MAIQELHDRLTPRDHDLDVEDDARVHRFGRTERLLHWWVVVMFAAALLTGIAMGDESESGSLLKLHIGSVALIGIGFVVALVVGDSRAVLSSAKDLFIFDRTDLKFVVNLFSHPGQSGHVRWGKFNIGQKILAWTLVASVAAIIVTGINSWSAGEGASGPHAAAVAVALVLLGAHVFMALINPATRPALPGMIFGSVRRTWAAKHHPAWLEEHDRQPSSKSHSR